MSKNIESYTLKAQMREDLMQCYREVAPNCITQYGAWRRTVKHPAKRFYVEEKWTVTRLRAYFMGEKDAVLKMKPNKRRLYLTLIGMIEEMSQKPEYQGMSLKKLVGIAIRQPAPEFFVDPYYMKLLFIREKHKRYDDNGCLLKEYKYDYGTRYKGKYTRVKYRGI